MNARTLIANDRLPVAEATETRELGEGVWRLAARGSLDADATVELRDACLRALERGAVEVVFELTGADVVGEEAVDVLGAVRDCLVARGGNLWIAVEGDGAALDRAVTNRSRKERDRDG